jgi:hypothetical protein
VRCEERATRGSKRGQGSDGRNERITYIQFPNQIRKKYYLCKSHDGRLSTGSFTLTKCQLTYSLYQLMLITLPRASSPSQFNAANACVCKSWSDIALSVLWRDVDLWRLVRLLGPLKKGLDSTYVCCFIMYYCVAFTHSYQIHRSYY